MNQKVRRMWACAKAMALTTVAVFGFAGNVQAQDDAVSTTFTVCAYNVDGLPNKIAGIEINPDGKGEEGAAAIGNYLNDKAFDVLALSEDFGYNSSLMAPLEADYNIGTWRGALDMGNYNPSIRFNTDGLEFLTRKPIVFGSELWTAWRDNYGKFDNGSDELITKGYRRYTVSLGNGMLVDFYTLHMDAGDTENDIAARASQWQQLRDAILSADNGHPVVVMGDTNSRYTRDDITGLFVTPLSESFDVNDVWVEKCLGGEAPALGTGSLMADSLGYEKGEIVDKVIYLNPKGSTLRLKATAMTVDADCMLSDHKPLSVTFEATGKAHNPAEAGTWWRGEEWTGNGQEAYLYNVGQKYFISNDFAPTVTDIDNAPTWNIWGDDEFTISNDTHRLQMKKQKAQQGVVEGSGATTFNNHEAGITEGSYRIGLKDWKTFLDQKTHFFAIAVEDGSAIYTAATTKDESLDWLLISPAQKQAYCRYNELYKQAAGYLDNAALNLPNALEQQLAEALAGTAASNYSTCAADTTTLVAACEAVEAWLYRDVELNDARYATLCLPWNASVPEGATVYYATEYFSRVNPNSVHLQKYEGSVIPANTGFVVYAEGEGMPGTLRFTFSPDSASLPDGNILVGTVDGIDNADLSFADFTYMTLGNNSLGNGFYAVDASASIPVCSAFLQLPTGGDEMPEAPSFAIFDFDYSTSLTRIPTTVAPGFSACYGISGKRQSRLQRGLNIVRMADGTVKKVAVR